MSSAAVPSVTVWYDGECRLCVREIRLMQRFHAQERGQGALSAVQELKQSLGIPVISIIRLNDLIDTLEDSEDYQEYLQPVLDYRKKYGVIS